MNKTKLMLAALVAGTALAGPAQALKINLIDTGGVTGSQAEKGFKIAAHYWESVLTNDAVVNFEVGFSDLGPSVLGGTNSNLSTYVPIDAYEYYVSATGNSSLDAIASANFAPTNVAGSVSVIVPEYNDPLTMTGIAASGTRLAPADGAPISSTIALSTANVKAIFGSEGIEDLVDGHIEFSSSFAFDFDPTNGISAGHYDFIGVAVHEMGHALGFLSGAQDFDYSSATSPYGEDQDFPTDEYWWGYAADMFRYSGEGELNWAFDQPAYFSIDGGATSLFDSSWSTGEINGDGWQASHWKAPGGCTDFVGIMNPYICSALTDQTTASDLALLDAIGWNTNVDVLANSGYHFTTAQMYSAYVPEPMTWSMMILGFGTIGMAARRRRTAVTV